MTTFLTTHVSEVVELFAIRISRGEALIALLPSILDRRLMVVLDVSLKVVSCQSESLDL